MFEFLYTTTLKRILLRSMPRREESKVKSLEEAMVILDDLTEYLTSEYLTETANDLQRFLSNVQSALG